MAPPLKPREDYTRDAQTILNIARAIEADPKRPVLWRKKMAERLRELSVALIQAPVI